MVVISPVMMERARAALRVLARRTRIRAAYMFGSQINGTADRWSDIDVAAFVDDADRWDLKSRVDVCIEARMEAGDDVELHLFAADALSSPPRASFAQYVIRNGVPIALGGDEMPPAM